MSETDRERERRHIVFVANYPPKLKVPEDSYSVLIFDRKRKTDSRQRQRYR